MQNQTSFFVPTNEETRSIDYGLRFMITDNPIHPKVYEITKLMDTFPLGCQKIVLAQSHYNSHTDLCKAIDLSADGIEDTFDDTEHTHMHYICDYYKSSITPSKDNSSTENDEEIIDNTIITWSLKKNINDKLYIHGQPQVIQAVPNVETIASCEWHMFIDNIEKISELDDRYEDSDLKLIDEYVNNVEHPCLEDYLDISIDNTNNTFTIAAINKDFARYVVKVAVYDDEKNYYDFVEMEVSI